LRWRKRRGRKEKRRWPSKFFNCPIYVSCFIILIFKEGEVKGERERERRREDKKFYTNFSKILPLKIECQTLLSLSQSFILHPFPFLSLFFRGAQAKKIVRKIKKWEIELSGNEFLSSNYWVPGCFWGKKSPTELNFPNK
jgi:hypothetical protein